MIRSLYNICKTVSPCSALVTSYAACPPRLPARLKHTMAAQPPTTPTPIAAKPFRLALIQLGGVGHDKQANLAQAKDKIAEAAKGDGGDRIDLVVLPVSGDRGSECGQGDAADGEH